MTASAPPVSPGLKAIARPAGGFAMVAIDQRDSLRVMFQAKQAEPVDDAVLKDFKVAVAETLGGSASAMLFDRHFGLDGLARIAERHPGCGRILAVDRLIQQAGQPVSDTEIDDALPAGEIRARGAVALKFLLLWKGPATAERCQRLAGDFMRRCRAEGFVGVLEAMVRPPEPGDPSGWDRDQAILDAASALAEAKPDLYKGEVPFQGRGDPALISERCAQISKAIGCPWVVLSQGVTAADFPRAVRAACEGGASGFLAGRAIWADIIGPGDYRSRLRTHALPRLTELTQIVDAAAKPWHSLAPGR
jgi:sulfofructosephosphate aldolase